MKENKYDLTTGSMLNKMLMISLPIMGTQFIQMTYNLTDMFWLGRLSSDAVAASGTVGMFLWLSMAFVIFGRMGAEIGVSQNMGRGDVQAAKKFSQNSFFLALILGLFFCGVLFFFRKPLIGIFDIQEEWVRNDAQTYLSIVALGVPLSFLSSVTIGTFNGSGNSRIPFLANTVGLVINVILDPILIFTFEMGIFGAAVATVIAQAIVCIISLFAIRFYKHRPFEDFTFFAKPSADCLMQIFKWGLPIALESMFFTLLSMSLTRRIASYGSNALAASRVCTQVESLSWLIAGGFGSAVTALIGQNYGAKLWSRIRKCMKLSFAAMTIWGVIITAVIFFFAKFLFGIFLNDEAILPIGTEYLKILAMCQVIGCYESVASGCFRGMGRTMPPSICSISCNAARVVLAYVLSSTSLGLSGIWWAIAIGAFMRGLVLFIWFLFVAKKLPHNDEELTLQTA